MDSISCMGVSCQSGAPHRRAQFVFVGMVSRQALPGVVGWSRAWSRL